MFTTDKDPTLNKSRQCEAILITHGGHDGCLRAGDQCDAKGTYDIDGRAVCWVHYQAATIGPRAIGTSFTRGSPGPSSSKPVEFVKPKLKSGAA